jgi:hypothetical protein
MKKSLLLCAAIAASLTVSAARAAPILIDKGEFGTDVASGLDWCEPTNTRAMSAEQATAELSTSGPAHRPLATVQ